MTRTFDSKWPAAVLALASVSVSSMAAAASDLPSTPTIRPELRELVEYDEYTGRFEAVRRVEVRARVGGYLDRIEFQEGQHVSQGDLLLVIDQRPFQVAVDAAEAALAEAVATRDLATLEAKRSRRLIEQRAIAQDEADMNEQQLLAAVARVAGAQAAVARAQLDLEFTEVRASISGRVGRREVDEGNLVAGGIAQATLLTTIVQEDPIYISFEVSEQDFLKYNRLDRSGARPTSRTTPNAVSVKLLDEDDYLHHGVMDFVDNELDPTSGTLLGRAVLANPGGFLQPGVFGRIRLQGSGLYEALLIPDEAIQFDQSRQFVYTVAASGVVERRWVELGPLIDGLRVIRTGLSGDEQVVAGGFHRVRAGDTVRPQPSPEPEFNSADAGR